MSNERIDQCRELILREARYLDRRQWDDWLLLFSGDCEFWIPTWISENGLGWDPKQHLSLIYFSNRAGLEERVHRLRSHKSIALAQLPRTVHMISDIHVDEELADGGVVAGATWCTYNYYQWSREVHRYFGRYRFELIERDNFVIRRKKIEILNDDYPAAIDFFNV